MGKCNFNEIEDIKTFLRTEIYSEKTYDEIRDLIDWIVEQPIKDDAEIMNMLHSLFFYKIKAIDIKEVLKQLKQIFIVNEYLGNFYDFFKEYDCLYYKAIDDQVIIWNTIQECLLTGEKNNFFFGMWLFEKMFITDMFVEKYTPQKIDVIGLGLVLKGILYYSLDAKRVCSMALKLSSMIADIAEAQSYLRVCLDEVYENYQHTFLDVIKSYTENRCKCTQLIIDEILEKHNSYIELQKKAVKIPDLKPSNERRIIYNRAIFENNEKINSMAREQSVFFDLFSYRKLKYGKRVAFIQTGIDGSLKHNVSPLASISGSYDLASLSVRNPIEWFYLKKEFFIEREKYCEVSNQRLSFTIERKR